MYLKGLESGQVHSAASISKAKSIPSEQESIYLSHDSCNSSKYSKEASLPYAVTWNNSFPYPADDPSSLPSADSIPLCPESMKVSPMPLDHEPLKSLSLNFDSKGNKAMKEEFLLASSQVLTNDLTVHKSISAFHCPRRNTPASTLPLLFASARTHSCETERSKANLSDIALQFSTFQRSSSYPPLPTDTPPYFSNFSMGENLAAAMHDLHSLKETERHRDDCFEDSTKYSIYPPVRRQSVRVTRAHSTAFSPLSCSLDASFRQISCQNSPVGGNAQSSVNAGEKTNSWMEERCSTDTIAPQNSVTVETIVEQMLNEMPGYFQGINVYEAFKPLLPCLWLFWELTLIGEPILVLCPSVS
ncbi:putative Protein DENND6-like protein, partial [Cardiosporidium cionae]